MGTLHNMQDYIDGEPPKFDPPSGGGDNGGMEARLARLELKVDNLEQKADRLDEKVSAIDTRLSRVESTLDHVLKEVSQFKWWVVAQIVAGILSVIGTGVAIQQMTVATFQAAAQNAQQPQAQQTPIIINVPSSK